MALVRSLILKTVLFQTIQFIISTHFSSMWPFNRTLSVATTPGQRRPWSDDNKGVLYIPNLQHYWNSPSDCLVSYTRHSLAESYPSAEMQLVHSAAPASWLMVKFLDHWSLSEGNSPQVTSTPLNIQADLNNAVVSMVSILLISNCHCIYAKPFRPVYAYQQQLASAIPTC